MIEGTNPQVGKVTVDEFAAAIKEKYPSYKDIDNLKLANAIIEKYPEYKDAVTFEPVAVEPVKKKDGFTPSTSSVGQSQLPAEPSNTFFQPVYDTADWLNKNIPVWSNWASVSTQMAGGMTTAVDGLVKEGVLFAMPEGQEKDDLKKKISETGIDSVIDTPLEGVANMMRDYGQEIKQQRQENYGISIEQQQLGVIGNFMNGDFISSSKLAIDGMTDGMIQAGLASLTGIAPLAVSAGGEKYYDVSNKPNYSSSERVVYSSAVGLAEGLIESVFSGDIKAFSKVLDSDLALKGFQEQLLKAARDTPWYKEFLKMGTEEGLEETLSESFGQLLLGVKEGVRPDATALGEAFISGFLPGGGTHIVTNGISAIGSEKRTKRRQQLGKQIKDIEDKIETVEDPSQKAILEEMIKGDIDELSKEIELDAELYADFSDEDVKETIKINTDIRKLYQKIGLAVSDEQKEAYKKEILEARSRKLEIENRYSEEPVRYIRDGKLVPKAQFIDMINKATPEEMSTGQWGVENDTEVEQLLASRMPQEKSVDAPVVEAPFVEAPVVEAPVAEETKVAKPEEEIKQEKLEQDVVDVQAKIDNLREEDGSIPEDKSQEFKDLTAVKKNATNRAKRGNSQSTVVIKKQKETGGNFEILDGEEKSFAIAVISKIIASSKTAEEALQKIFSRGYNIDADALGLYLNDKLDSSAPQVGNNKDSFEAWVQGKSDAELSALKKSTEGTPAVEAAVAKEPVAEKKTDWEKMPSIPMDAEIEIQDIVAVKDNDGDSRLFARYPLKNKPIKSFFEIKQEKDGTVKRVSDKSYGPAEKTLKRRLAKEEPKVKKIDIEAISIEENTIADAEFRIEDLQSDIDIEKGNIKEAKDKAKEDIAAARKSKLPKEEKAEKIEEIKAELQDTVDDINGNIGNNKEDISGYKSDIRKANKRIAKLKAVPSVKAKEQLSKETKTEELEIVLLDEQGGRKKLTQTALSDPRNIQKGKMTVEYSDKGLTFKTESDTGRMKENGGELFVSNKEIESIPNINKYKKGTKEYAFQVAEVIGIADQYKGDPIKLMKDSFVKAQDIGKEGTPSAKRFTPAQGAKLAKMVDNFNRIIKRIGVSPVKIVFVNSPAEFKQYYEYTTGSKKETLSKASYLPLQKEIIVDLSKADMTTLAHEMLHAYVSAIKLDRKKITLFTGIIEAELLKGSDAEVKLAKELAAFRDEYIKQGVYGKGRTKNDAIIAEEFLAEYVGIMSAYSDNLSPAKQVSFIDKIRAAVVKFLAKIGVVDKSLTAKIQNREDALNFINGFVDALGGRIDITTDAERSAVVNSKNPYKASRLQLDTPVGSRIANKPLKDSRSIAISYMESKGLKHIDGALITNLNEDTAKRISDAYIAMKNDPKNLEVAAAYKAMAEETLEQYEAILKGGYNIEVNNNEPYNNSNELIEDLRKNKNMRIFSTDSGFGDEGITAEQRKDNPLLSETKYKDINGRTLLVNDVFRFVHDFFGHAERGNGFGPIGEENAWDVHSRMYSPLARKALTAETRGQNSYVNFSGVNDEAFKLRDKGRELRKEGKFEEAQKFTDKAYATMKFAPQKVGLLADEFVANPYLKQDSQESEPIAREQIDAVNIISADTPKQKAKKEAVAEILNGFAESQLGPNSSEQDLVSRFLNNIFEESLYTLKKGPRESGMTWYIEDITEFENKMTVLLPELSDPNQMKLFKQILAITSSGTNPNQNLQTAYTLWLRSNGSAVNFAKNWGEDKISFITKKGVAIGTGIIARETKTKYIVQKVDALGNPEVFKNGTPKLFEAKKSELKDGYPKPAGFTARGNIVAQQLTKIEKVYEAVGRDINKLIEFFEKPQPVSELRKYNKGVPDVDGNIRKVAVGKRNGAFIFGEKIGAFYQNMIGIGDTITMDLWWSRTWNRYMGTMLSTVDNKQVIQETPRTDRERDIMRKSVTLAANKLGLDVSELQAVIWYFEQELWTKAGNVSPSFSYVTAVESLNNKITTDEQIQKRFSEAGADLTAAEKRRQDAIARANNIIAEGGIQGDVDRDQIDFAGVDMKAEETPSSKNASIPTGGTAYVPVSKLYNLMDMRDGDRGGLYEKAEDKKRVKNLVDKIRKEGFEYKGSDALYIDIDADGYGWIGEGNHRVLAAIELGMSHLPVRVEFGQARDDKSTYSDGWSRVPTRVISKEKIAELKEKAGPYYHIKYASIWETDLPTNKEPISRDQIDWQPSLFGKGQVNPAIINRNTFVQEAAADLLQGKITNAEYDDVVRITQAVDPITQFFLPASTKDIQAALDKNKGKLIAVPLKDGEEIGLRLDIPAYKNRNIWVVSIHEKGKSGKPISYGSVAWATDVTFGSNPKVASFIAAGKNMDTLKKQDKTTIARMLGKWKNFEGKTQEDKDASAVKKVEDIVAIESSFPGSGRKGSPWRQIGMNPFRHSYFYDRRNGQPVIAAAEVVQIGGLVYAKDVVYADKNDPIFNVEGYKDANGETVRFQLEDQQENENNNKETYSAVEDNQEGLFDAGVDELVDIEVSNTDSWKERPRTTFEKFIDLTRLKIQDSFRKVIRVQEDVEYSSGKPVGLDQDFRNAEALMHGKAKEELNKTDKKVADIAAKISASGLSVEQFNELLYAMHAQERNRFLRVISTDVGASLIAMRKKLGIKPSEIAELLGISTQEYNDIEANKKELKTDVLSDILLIYGTTPSRFFYDNAKVKEGSGMTDVEARKILASYDLNLASPDVSQLSTKVRVAVESVRSLMQDTRDVLLESGLETQSTIDAFEAAYKNYVPLRGFADSDVDSEILEGGRKLEVRGREKRAKGRNTKADSPLTQIIVSNTTNIVRGEKNRVMNKFYNLAVNNPNKDVYQVVDPKITKEYKRDFRNGKIVTTAKTISDYLLDPNMISVRVDGDYKFVRFKDASLAEALRGANVAKAQWMVKYIGAFNRTLSSFITTYDPEFILRNFSRDIQTAVLNLYAEQEMTAGLIKDKNIVANVIKDTFPALRSILAVEGGISGKKKESDNKEMDQYYREFKEDGARTEWFYSKSSEEVQKDIEKLISGKKDTALQAAGNLVERINSSVENAVRLSSYVNARKAGVSRAKSAELAKNLTVNFNKSGEWGQIANTLFLFFNASVQGVSRLARTLKPNYITDREGNRTLRITTAQKMAVGLMLLGSIMSLLNEGLSDDDEDDGKSFYSKIPDFEKERNYILMHPNGKDYFKIPLPYGVNVFYVTGTLIADASQKIKTPGEVAGGIMQAALGSFSPINFPNSDDTINFFEKFITPTIGQVPLALAINENYFGQTIYNENFPFDASPKPDSELGKKSGNRWTKELTKFLNKVSGGSEFRSGEIDINPDKIDFVMESYSGGMGKFVGRSANVVDKVITGNLDQLEARQIPGVRVFYGQISKYANFQEFYTRSTLVNQMQEEVKNKIILGPEAKRVSKIFYLGKNTRKQLSNLKKREDFVMKIKDPEDQKVRMEKLEKLRYKLVADYNKQYEKFEIDKIK